MKVAICSLESAAAYSQSRFYMVDKKEKESPDDYEKRTWRERMHVTEKGQVFIPPMAFKNALDGAAALLSMKIKGKNMQTYTKHFVAGVMVHEPVVLPIKKEDVPGQWLFVPSDGKKGGSKRVMKCFPRIDEWKAEVTFFVYDDTITEEIFSKHLIEAGRLVGIGYFRPARGGYWGRFTVLNIAWQDMA